jgi:hypothetical protein
VTAFPAGSGHPENFLSYDITVASVGLTDSQETAVPDHYNSSFNLLLGPELEWVTGMYSLSGKKGLKSNGGTKI